MSHEISVWFSEESKCTAVPVGNGKKCKRTVDSGQTFNTLLIDFSTAFGYQPNELIISKLTSSECSLKALLINNFKKDEKRTRIEQRIFGNEQ